MISSSGPRSGSESANLLCRFPGLHKCISWWRHQMETFSASLAFVRGIHRSPTQRPVTRSFDVFFDLRLNKRLSKQPWGWWFETPSWSLWRQCNVLKQCWTCYGLDSNDKKYIEHGIKIQNVSRNDVMKWKRFPHYWPFVRGLNRWIPLTQGKCCRAVIFYLMLAWTNCWKSSQFDSDLGFPGAHSNISRKCIWNFLCKFPVSCLVLIMTYIPRMDSGLRM